MASKVRVENLTKEFIMGGETIRALDDVTLSVESGEMVAVVGPSGCGKTTLLNLIGQLELPTAGQIFLDGALADPRSAREAAKIRNQTFGYVVQDFALVETDTALENAEIPLIYSSRKRGRRQRVEIVQRSLDRLGVGAVTDQEVARLSGGQRQRVAIARAIVNEPQIILADEPTGALDSDNSFRVFDVLRSLAEQQKAVIIATHDLDMASRCDRVVVLRDGQIV